MTARRYLALDGLRGVAALAVVFYHAPWPTHFSGLALARNAYLSVDLFFILSGFVIAANYATKIVDAGNLRDFLTRRLFRLYPLHLAVLAALVALETVKWAAQGMAASDVAPFTGPNSPALLAENLLMLQGVGLGGRLGWNSPAWSIGAECVAYVLFAFAALSGLARRSLSVLATAGIALLTYFGLAAHLGTLDATFGGVGLLRCLAGFSLGVVVFLYAGGEKIAPLVVAFAAALALFVMASTSGAAVAAVIPVFVLLVAGLRHDRGGVARLLASAPTQFLGRHSYSIYLTHMPILTLVTILAKRLAHLQTEAGPHGAMLVVSPFAGDLLFTAVICIVIALSCVTFRLVEEPGRKLGARLSSGARAQNRDADLVAHGIVPKR